MRRILLSKNSVRFFQTSFKCLVGSIDSIRERGIVSSALTTLEVVTGNDNMLQHSLKASDVVARWQFLDALAQDTK